ncbi:hypothetical protein [uncultured Maribacter sp.]|uniref:hypothetical protein n=1 Tax=uncultured Maribacter sp. TaxID=431308 RepID=UPI00261A730D|nr:hypothetical protein [uncultured Maribacter sp.]
MKVLKSLFNFYLDASIHVALAVVSLLLATGLLFSIKIDNHLLSFVFFSTICGYNFIKYGVEAKKYILVANKYHKNIQLFSFIALAICIYTIFYLQYKTILGLLVLLALTGLYAIPVLPHIKKFRDFGGFKIISVAMVWAGITVIIPVLNIDLPLTWDVWVETIQRFILVLILLIPFEIRDLKYDSPELKTLPQRYGVTKSKIIGAFGVLVFFLLIYVKDTITTIDILSKGILFLTLGILMYVTKRNQNKYFASFWVESIPIFWYILFLFFPL